MLAARQALGSIRGASLLFPSTHTHTHWSLVNPLSHYNICSHIQLCLLLRLTHSTQFYWDTIDKNWSYLWCTKWWFYMWMPCVLYINAWKWLSSLLHCLPSSFVDQFKVILQGPSPAVCACAAVCTRPFFLLSEELNCLATEDLFLGSLASCSIGSICPLYKQAPCTMQFMCINDPWASILLEF